MLQNYKAIVAPNSQSWDPDTLTLSQFIMVMQAADYASKSKVANEPWEATFGLAEKKRKFERDPITGLFNDKQMVEHLQAAMEDPICKHIPTLVRCKLSSSVRRSATYHLS